MDRRNALFALTSTAFGGGLIRQAQAAQPAADQKHVEWVLLLLQQMLRVKPGMTRADLTRVFATEGGLSTGLQRTFVSQDCPYFKVDVTFRAVGRPDRDPEGRVTLTEDPKDQIVSVSKPYLNYSVAD